MSRKALLLATLAFMAARPSATAPGRPDVAFHCGQMPEICTNMCWAVRCASPAFPQILRWDSPDAETARQRRKSAGCGPGNKCNKGKRGPGHRGDPYISCDEYPFASTKESTFPNGRQVSRCVPATEHSRQGGALGTAYSRFRRLGVGQHRLNVVFGNPGARGVRYCTNTRCKNDGWEVQDGRISKRGGERLFKYYRTSSGMVIASLEDLEIGANFTRQVDDGEQVAPHLEAWMEAVDEVGDVHVLADVVLEEMPFEEAAETFDKEEQVEGK